MSVLRSVAKMSRDIHRLEKRARYLWAEFSAHRANKNEIEASRAWVELTRAQYAIAALLGALHTVTENAYDNHIHQYVDSRESATGVFKHPA